jgi:hypothetical protein
LAPAVAALQAMPEAPNSFRDIIRKESALFLMLLLTGLFFLPVVIYIIGNAVFGAYEGSGFMDFYGTLHSELRAGQRVVWFLMLSPYIVWQLSRLTAWGFRRLRERTTS